MDVDEPATTPDQLAEFEDPLAPIGKGRITLTEQQRERLMGEMQARPPMAGVDATKVGSKATDWKYPDGTILRFFQGAQMNLYLMLPGKPPGRKVFSLENPAKNPAPVEAVALRRRAFEMAKKLMPVNDLELAAIRDTVLKGEELPLGTPGPPVAKTPGFPMPPTPGPRPPGAASGSGASGSGQYT
jgi:hypothetical protein